MNEEKGAQPRVGHKNEREEGARSREGFGGSSLFSAKEKPGRGVYRTFNIPTHDCKNQRLLQKASKLGRCGSFKSTGSPVGLGRLFGWSSWGLLGEYPLGGPLERLPLEAGKLLLSCPFWGSTFRVLRYQEIRSP